MKKVLFILLLSFVNFAFTTNEKIEPISAENNAEITSSITEVKIFETEKGIITVVASEDGICENGTMSLSFNLDCDGDGQTDYAYSGRVCREHYLNMMADFQSRC